MYAYHEKDYDNADYFTVQQFQEKMSLYAISKDGNKTSTESSNCSGRPGKTMAKSLLKLFVRLINTVLMELQRIVYSTSHTKSGR